MDPQSLVAGLLRGLGLMSLAVVIGGLVLDRLILPAAGPNLETARGRLRHLIIASLVALPLTTCADLVIRTQTMSRAPLAAAIPAIPDVVTGTHAGAILAVRVVILVLALALSLTRGAVLRVLCLLLALTVALTLALTGHADDWGDLTVSVAVDWAHAVAASAWTGGLFVLALVVLRRTPEWTTGSLVVLAPRFSRLAGVCLLVVVVTGI